MTEDQLERRGLDARRAADQLHAVVDSFPWSLTIHFRNHVSRIPHNTPFPWRPHVVAAEWNALA